jgi:glycine oxidase
MSEITVDYLIVGQGLAGSCVAWQLLKAGKRIAVIDQRSQNRCSIVAAGLFNPVTGQHLKKTWLARETFEYLHSFYPEIEQAAKTDFFYPLPLYRPFISVEEQNEWLSHTVDPVYDGILKRVNGHSQYAGLHDSLGGITLAQSGFINTQRFLDTVREIVIKNGYFFDERCDYGEIVLPKESVQYRNITARKILFCEGVHTAANPWFSGIPMRPLKGETLEIKSDFAEQVIVNRGVYMVPGKEKGEWKIGSTYNARDKSEGNTANGIEELKGKLKQLLKSEFDIIRSDWGIRPTTPDRRPIMGAHPTDNRLIIFNGLGTKGVSLAPYFSDILVRWLENGAPVAKEVDVTRFKVLS